MILVSRLAIGYGGKALVRDISFGIAPGECILLAGPNGSGKSTFLRTLAGVLPPVEGTLTDLSGAFRAALIPTGIPKVRGFTAAEFIRTGCFSQTDWKGAFSPEDRQRMEEAAGLLGIGSLTDRDISTLSDGEFQLACIATGLTRHCDLLLLDEPTAFLDVDNRIMVLRALKQAATRTPVLFTSHDIADAAPLADRIFAMVPCLGEPGADAAPVRFTVSGPDSQSKEAVLREAFRNL